MRTEVEVAALARQGLANPHPIEKADKAQTRFILSAFRSDRRLEVPATADRSLPGPNPSLPSLVEGSDTSRVELAVLSENIPEEKAREGIFKHPVGGWMDMGQILDFFSAHLIHHGYQLDRLRHASESSKP